MKVFTIIDNVIGPLGQTTEANFDALRNGLSGVEKINDSSLSEEAFFGAKINYEIPLKDNYTHLENLFILSIEKALLEVDINLDRTILVLSSTKGNIDQLAKSDHQVRVKLPEMAEVINEYFRFKYSPLLVSNACISGVSALLVARNLIEMGTYDHAVVSGGDLLSEFTLSGFNCLKAVSEHPCKPYDVTRDGISLGEGVGTMILSNNTSLLGHKNSGSEIIGGGQSNDANHISGPSRTGAGLNSSIRKALMQSSLDAKQIDYINAHGTATLFNDEMESIAFSDLEMDNIPLNSLKGYFGHTLGAAGIIESIMTIRQMNTGHLIESKGFEELGVSRSINVLKAPKSRKIDYALKTVSGFGGSNAAIVFKKL